MLLIALALAQSAPFDIRGDYAGMIRKHCSIEWPEDYRMQEYCADQQNVGMREVKRAYDEFGSRIAPTIENCVSQWTRDRLPDWAMIGYCARQQADSYRRLQP